MTDKHITDALNTGILLGANESFNALKKFLNQKRNDGHSDHITYNELTIFMTAFISQKEKLLERFKLN